MIRQDDIITRLPGQASCNQVDSKSRVGNQCDFLRLGIDHLGGQIAQVFMLPEPVWPTGRSFKSRLLGSNRQTIAGHTGNGSDSRVVKIGPFLGDGHLLTKGGPVDLVDSQFRICV